MAPKRKEGAEEAEGHVNQKARLAKSAYDGIVELLVGPQEELFIIHKQLLCNKSPYFEAAFKGKFKEANKQQIKLPEDDVTAFKQFQHWLYAGKALPNPDITDCTDEHEAGKVLVHLYVLGDKFQIPTLQNAAIHGIIKTFCVKMQVPHGLFLLTYALTPPKSQIRKLFVDIFVHASIDGAHTRFSETVLTYYPHEFLFDVVQAYSKLNHANGLKPPDFRAIRSQYYIEVC